jgi:hypothetical protein
MVNVIMVIVIMVNVIMVIVIMVNVIVVNVIMVIVTLVPLYVIMANAIMLNAIIVNVTAWLMSSKGTICPKTVWYNYRHPLQKSLKLIYLLLIVIRFGLSQQDHIKRCLLLLSKSCIFTGSL